MTIARLNRWLVSSQEGVLANNSSPMRGYIISSQHIFELISRAAVVVVVPFPFMKHNVSTSRSERSPGWYVNRRTFVVGYWHRIWTPIRQHILKEAIATTCRPTFPRVQSKSQNIP